MKNMLGRIKRGGDMRMWLCDGALLVYVYGILQSIETRRRRSSTSIMVACDSKGKVGG